MEMIKRQLSNDERDALDFLEDSIIYLSPNGPHYPNLVAHTKAYFYFLIQK
ncbi:hypothetical protein BDCR2A_01436 [Borrelia duttonii CR2A]|uniref:Uncharacterized protein n=1 Tax=Borrelia duttonii CR2A TaxID=1432657 RepID=W6TGQ5_9SPIR|nr:hypothetical protein BDCR2A_01436 [Borrelia duttonii CR2A]